MPASAKPFCRLLLNGLAGLLLASHAAAAADDETVTIISGAGAEVQSLDTYRKEGTQLYFSFSPLSQKVVPNQRRVPSPYVSGWNHLAPSRYWQKKIGQKPARHTLGYVTDESRWQQPATDEIDWSKVKPGPAPPQ